MYSELPTSGLPPKRAILRWAIVRFTGDDVDDKGGDDDDGGFVPIIIICTDYNQLISNHNQS